MKPKKKPEIRAITSSTIAGTDLEGIIRIESPAELDRIAGGDSCGPVIPPVTPTPPTIPPTCPPSDPPSTPAWGPYPSVIET